MRKIVLCGKEKTEHDVRFYFWWNASLDQTEERYGCLIDNIKIQGVYLINISFHIISCPSGLSCELCLVEGGKTDFA